MMKFKKRSKDFNLIKSNNKKFENNFLKYKNNTLN